MNLQRLSHHLNLLIQSKGLLAFFELDLSLHEDHQA
jgi:hypothetical protein